MSSNLHPINGGRVLAPVRFISAVNLLKHQFLKSLFVVSILFGMGGSVWGQTTVSYTTQMSNFNHFYSEKNNNPPFAGTYNNGAEEIAQYANSGSFGNTPGAAAFQSFTTTGNGNSGTNRTLRVGDRFTITVYTGTNPSSGGRIGISFRNTTTATNFFSSTDDNTIARFQLDDLGGWKIYHGGGIIENTNAAPGADRTLTIEVTSSNSFNAIIAGTTYYDLIFSTSGDINQFCIYTYGDSNPNSFWKNASLSNFGQVNGDGLRFGYGLSSQNSVSINGVISDGTNTNSTSTSVTNIVYVGGASGTSVTLSGLNTYSGITTINANAQLKLGANSASNANGPLGTTATGTIISSGGVLDMNGFSLTAAASEPLTINGTGISSGGALVNTSATSSTWSGPITLGSNTSIGGVGNLTIDGSVSGAFNLSKTGSGITTLEGENDYSGATTISGGTLQLNRGGGATIPSTNDVAVNNGGTLRISTNQTLENLTVDLGGTVTVDPGIVLTVTGNFTNNGTVSGTGKIVMGGSSAQTISGTGTITNLEINKTVEGVTISSGVGNMQSITGVLTPTAGTLTTNGNLTLKSSADGTASVAEGSSSGGYISGDVIVERYFNSKRAWRLVTAPVYGGTNSVGSNWQTTSTTGNAATGTSGVLIWAPPAGNVGLSTGPRASMRGWNNLTGAYEDVIDASTPLFSSTNAENPRSFFLFATGPHGSNNIASGQSAVRVSAKGLLRQGTQTFEILNNEVRAGGFYMIGNPYASPVNHGYDGTENGIDIYYTQSTPAPGTIWFWDPNLNTVGGYVSFQQSSNNYSVGNGWTSGSSYTRMQSGQAFFIQAPSTMGSQNLKVVFTEEKSKGSGANNGIFRNINATQFEKIRVSLQRNASGNYISSDGAVALFYPEGAKEVNNEDGVKLMNASNNLMFRRNGTNLTFEHRPTIQDDDTLFLNLRSTNAGSYRLIIEGSNFENGHNLEAFLQDAYLNREEALKLDSAVSYDFTVDADAATSGERFRIVFHKKFIPPPQEIGTDFSAYPNPLRAGESLSVKFRNREAGKYTVAVYNLLGVQVQQQVLLHGGGSSVHNIALQASLPAGTYLLQVMDGSSKKIDALKFNVQ
jgi:autotransporter-associated beta strand protein